MKKYELIASCASGLETLVEEEVLTFGGEDVHSANGVVTWKGSLESGIGAVCGPGFPLVFIYSWPSFPLSMRRHCIRNVWMWIGRTILQKRQVLR